MRTMKFRHNKYSPGILYIMLILGIMLGFLVSYEFLVLSGISKGPEYAPAHFRDNPEHAVYLMFGLIIVSMVLPAWIAVKCWSRQDEESTLELYEDHAVLYWKNKEVYIKKGELNIKILQPQAILYRSYILKVPGQKIAFVNSIQEGKEKRRRALSLDIAIDILLPYKKSKKGSQKDNSMVDFHGINIALGLTSSAVFDNSPYYVEYENGVIVSDETFIACYVREKGNPLHVVGDVKIDIRPLDASSLNETQLKPQAILEIIELDENIEL